MKLRLLSLSILALLALSSCKDKLTGPPNAPSTPSDTIAYWTFEGNTNDVSGHGHDASMINASYGAGRFGTANKALMLNPNSQVSVASTSDLNMLTGNAYTVSVWVNLTITGTDSIGSGRAGSCVLSKMAPAQYAEQTGYQIYAAGSYYDPGHIDIYNTAVMGLPTGNDELRQGQLSKYPINSGEWHMVTLVIAPHQTISYYIDSVLIESDALEITDGIANNSAPLTFGPLPYGSAIDDILMTNTVMSASEVAARFHEGGWYTGYGTIPSPWNTTTSTTTENFVAGQFVNSTTGFVSGEDGVVLQTGDAGSTWNLKNPAPVFTGSNTGNIYGVSFFDASTGFAAGDQRDISLTTDGGSNWTLMDASNLSQSELIRSICFANRNNGFVGTSDAVSGGPSGSIYQTLDGGITWNPVFHTQGGIFNINFNIPGSNGMNGTAIGRYGVSYWTADGGTTWNTGSSDQPNSTLYRTTFTSATTGFAVGTGINAADTTHGYILRTDDGGHSWKTIYTIALGLNGIASLNGSIITAAGYGGVVIESTDGGTTWTQSNAGNSRWGDVQCVNKRTFLFGVNGNIAHRDR